VEVEVVSARGAWEGALCRDRQGAVD